MTLMRGFRGSAVLVYTVVTLAVCNCDAKQFSTSSPVSLVSRHNAFHPNKALKVKQRDATTLASSSNVIGRGGGSSESSSNTGSSSVASSVFNLVNNVAGAGILTLAAGKAKGTGWVPSILICVVLGVISGHTFSIVGEACELTGETTFKGLWEKTIGANSTYVVDSMIAILCIACAIIYSGILGDVFTPLLASAGLPSAINKRSSNIIVLTTFLLFPLSLIKDLSALAFTSILGFSAIAYTVLFMVVRALDGTYSLGTGRFLQDASIAMPSFTKSSMYNLDFSSLVLASNLGLAYIAHYNGPTFYRSLHNTNSKRFRCMVNIAFTILTLLYIVTMSAGYATFGDAVEGNILLNYHPSDILSTIASIATGFSILFGFPLVLTGAREAIIGVAKSLQWNVPNHTLLVSLILMLVTAISITVKDVSLVVGLTGAVMGSFIVYICPPIVYTNAVKLFSGEDSPKYRQSKINLGLIPFGLAIAGLGAYMTLKEAGLL